MSRLRLGFIGAGRMGEFHARLLSNLADRVTLIAVTDVAADRAAQLAGEHDARHYTDYRVMFDREELDAVFILTPPAVRLEPIRIACEKAIAVFVEKPPALQLGVAQQIATLIDTSGVINNVGFMYRWLNVVERAQELLKTQTVANVLSMFLCGVALDPTQPRWTFQQAYAGGPLLEQAIHSLDLLRYLVGEAAQVTALGGNPILSKSQDITIEDSHSISVRFQSGAVGVHLHSWVHREAIVQVRLFGVDFDLTVNVIPPGSLSGGVRGEKVEFSPADDAPYATQLSAFVEAVETQNRSILRSPFRDAVKSFELTLTAMQSVSLADEAGAARS